MKFNSPYDLKIENFRESKSLQDASNYGSEKKTKDKERGEGVLEKLRMAKTFYLSGRLLMQIYSFSP